MDRLLFLFILCTLFMGCEEFSEAKKEAGCVFKMPQQEVWTYKGIDEVLAQLEKVTFKKLDTAYLSYSDPDQQFHQKLAGETYYVVKGEQVFLPLVGKFRIRDFIVPDKYYKRNLDDLCSNHQQYWLADKKMLYMLLDLMKALKKKGHDPYGFEIRVGHRHPYWNKKVWSGARFSQHIYGKAVDIKVGDINRNGRANQADKKIVLQLLEKIVGNKGGIGLYPQTMCLHFDSRGHRARWNHQ